VSEYCVDCGSLVYDAVAEMDERRRQRRIVYDRRRVGGV
jgi:hypothetical protein